MTPYRRARRSTREQLRPLPRPMPCNICNRLAQALTVEDVCATCLSDYPITTTTTT